MQRDLAANIHREFDIAISSNKIAEEIQRHKPPSDRSRISRDYRGVMVAEICARPKMWFKDTAAEVPCTVTYPKGNFIHNMEFVL
jgi:hypothetical protein